MPKGVKGGRRLRAFLRKAKAAQSSGVRTVEVGFFEGEKYPDSEGDSPVPVVAAAHEFGSKKHPEKPFFRRALIGIEKELRPVVADSIDPQTMTLNQAAADRVGRTAADRVRRSVETHKLVDTRKLASSVDHRTKTSD
ncbi:MAG: hypothetical protein OXG35_27480 [Acidobacteria bacterium]|nr:hypothetical protein [Acidobacteriota bacterium]